MRLPDMSFATNNRVLRTLSATTREAVGARCEPVTLEAGDVLHRMGDVTSAVYFPETAVISTLASYSDGSGVEMANVGREACSALNLILRNPRQLAADEVQIAGRALRLPAERFRELKSEYRDFENALFSVVQSVLYQAMVSGACNAAHEAKPRLARWLLTMGDRTDGNEMRLTHDFLAHMLGVRRATVTNAALDLQSQGLIKYARGRLKITDIKGLRGASCECYDLVRSANADLLPDKRSGG
ncbi:Crp/Fnr family transcriptional regulator [Roseovarius sp.]|uniref:Crp/Fnr family transcriptional regulator n=1 Tax=Roseovarius sp. TaxID=1486281 RepID=UPI003D0E9D26